MTPLVFISYSHDSEAHKGWALKFATDLRAFGIDAILDQWDLKLGQDLARFMESGITKSNRVLLICTDNYVSKANSGTGGVGYERLIVNAEVASSIDTMKFIPCIRGSTTPKIPTFLGARAYIDFSEDKDYQTRLEELARELLGVPANAKPPLGQSKGGALDGLVSKPGLFTRIESTTAPSVFFEKSEPLTMIEGYGRSGTKPVMPDGPKFYLRLIPTCETEPLSSAKAYEIVRGPSRIGPMSMRHSEGYFDGRNKYGAIDILLDTQTSAILSATQIFRNREIWGIDRTLLKDGTEIDADVSYLPSIAIERVYKSALTRYLKTAKDILGLRTPIVMIAGATGVEGFRMAVQNYFDRFSPPIFSPNIEFSAEINSYDQDASTILLPFFQRLWEECGIQRPEGLT